MSTDTNLNAELYKMVRKEIKNTHYPQIRKVMDRLDIAYSDWINQMSKLSAATNAGSDEKMVDAMRNTVTSMAKYEKVLDSAVQDLRMWRNLFTKWSGHEGPAPDPLPSTFLE